MDKYAEVNLTPLWIFMGMVIAIFLILLIVIKVIIPLVDEFNYIRMELRRSETNNERRYWKRKLIRFFVCLIPVLGPIIVRKHKHR